MPSIWPMKCVQNRDEFEVQKAVVIGDTLERHDYVPQLSKTHNKIVLPKASLSKWEQVDYYYQKPIDHSQLGFYAPCITDAYKSDQNKQVIQYITEHVQDYASEEVRQTSIIKIGFTVLKQGLSVQEFEWDSKSHNNLVVGLFQRHFSA